MHPNKLTILINILLIAAICIFAWCIISCNPEKKIQRQDNAAVERVQARRPLLDMVGEKWRDLNPCVSDTVLKMITGETITNTTFDTLYLQGANDTVFRNLMKTVVKVRVDTFRYTVTDTNALDSANAKLFRQQLAYKDQQVIIEAKNGQISVANKKAHSWLWWLIVTNIVWLAIVSRNLWLKLLA